MTASLENRIAIVTGASRGIGAEIARTLARAGATVIVNYCGSRQAAEAVCKEIAATGGEALAVQGDVSNPDDVRGLFDIAIDHFKRLDILVNNAGVLLSRPIADIGDEEFDHVLNINVKGVFYTLREAASRLAD